jgi:hypothetical protein
VLRIGFGVIVGQAFVVAVHEGVVAVHVRDLDAGEGAQEALQPNFSHSDTML